MYVYVRKFPVNLNWANHTKAGGSHGTASGPSAFILKRKSEVYVSVPAASLT